MCVAMLYINGNVLRLVAVPATMQIGPSIVLGVRVAVFNTAAVVVILRLVIVVAVVVGGGCGMIVAAPTVVAVAAAARRGVVAAVVLPEVLLPLLVLTEVQGALTVSIMQRGVSPLASIALRTGLLLGV